MNHNMRMEVYMPLNLSGDETVCYAADACAAVSLDGGPQEAKLSHCG